MEYFNIRHQLLCIHILLSCNQKTPKLNNLEIIILLKKFDSLSGISLHAANPNEKVKIALSINCMDIIISEESKSYLIRGVLDDIIYPEVIQRSYNNALAPDFRLYAAHVLMFGNAYKNKVLLNEEVSFCGKVILKEGMTNNNNQAYLGDIKEVLGLYSVANLFPDAAHIMLLKVGVRWYAAWDLIYNKQRAMVKANTAKDFLKSSENDLANQIWQPFIHALYTATELAIQSILLMFYSGEFSTNQSSDTTLDILRQFAENGNIPQDFLRHYIEIKRLMNRSKNQISMTDSLRFDHKKGTYLFAKTSEIIDFAIKRTTFDGRIDGTIIYFNKSNMEKLDS